MTDLLWLDFIYRGITIRIRWKDLEGKNSKQIKAMADQRFKDHEKRIGKSIN
jgi:hypothetical protein